MFDADAQRTYVVTAGHCATKRKTSSSTAAECVEESTVGPIDSQLPLAGESSVSIGFEFAITDAYLDCAVLPLCPPKEETLHALRKPLVYG